MAKQEYFSNVSGNYETISAGAYSLAQQLHDDGYIQTSNRYRSVSRPKGDFSTYGYEWHARCGGQNVELDPETFAAFRELIQTNTRCRECGQREGHVAGCKAQQQDLRLENERLRAKLTLALTELAEYRGGAL
jgi:hypothetical protein